MATKRQIVANQANARRSTGPRTQEGKERVRLNGFRHGLTGQAVVMFDEDRTAYLAHCRALFDQLKPVGAMENSFVQQIADTQWRLNRAAAYESTLIALGGYRREEKYRSGDIRFDNALAQAETLAALVPSLATLSIYEQRLMRKLEKNLALLKEWQDRRRWREDMAEAKRRYEPNKPEKDPDDDRPDSDAALQPETCDSNRGAATLAAAPRLIEALGGSASAAKSSAHEEIGFAFSDDDSGAAHAAPATAIAAYPAGSHTEPRPTGSAITLPASARARNLAMRRR